jgi:hypothetical protein
MTPIEEAFAVNVVRWGNLSRAYREACNVGENVRPQYVWQNASHLASRPDVARRIDELKAEATERAVVSHTVALQYAWDVATADPRAISYKWDASCRYCHGSGFKYQWRDVEEFTVSCELAERTRQPLPSFDGGTGYDAHVSPNPLCPHCLGKGEEHSWYCDPRTLTGKEALLYAGMCPKRGVPLCRDQDAAWERVCRLMGWNKETVKLPERTVEETGPMTPERAERGYMALIRGGKAG